MIRYFEAFAGIGAFRSAFEKVGGFKCVGWCEIDRFAQKAYRALYDTGGEAFYEDITKIDYRGMPDFDLHVGGPCCQSFSVAGNRRAFEDDRGNLFFNYIEILEAKRPRYFIAENVPNLLGISQGECFRILLEKICELGYSVCWRVLNSAGFGIPQSRRRLFLVGYLGNRCPVKVLAFGRNDEENCEKGKPEQLIGGSQGSRVYSTNGTAVTQCSGSGGLGGKTGLYFIDYNSPSNITDTARCITARQDSGISHHKGEHSAVFCDLNENPQITENARCLHTRMDQRDAGPISGKGDCKIFSNGTTGEKMRDVSHDLQRNYDAKKSCRDTDPRAILNPFKENTRQNGRRIKEPNEPMFTLTVTDRHGIVHRGRIRRLMPSECWRLQGFTREQFEKVIAAGMSDAQLYKQAGNSITVNVVEAIARNLLEFDREVNAYGK